jgi:HK97 family phage major capsid protein
MSFELIAKKQEELSSAVAQMREANDARLKQLESRGGADPVLNEKVEKANSAVDRIEKQIEEIKTAMSRTKISDEIDNAKGKKGSEHKQAFNKFLRKGDERMTEVELKSMSVGTDADGGYLVAPEVAELVDVAIREATAMRQLATVRNIGTSRLDVPVKITGASSGWAAETGARAASTTPTFDKVAISTYDVFANPQATQQFLDDSSVDVESWLATELSDEFAETEGTAFISGDGTNKPKGILAYTAGTSFGQIQQVASGTSGDFDGDDLITLLYTLKEPYARNASFIMNRSTVKKVRLFKDSNGQYIWQPGLQAGQPSSLLGRPCLEDPNMPAVGAAALAVAVGDFKRGYYIVDRVGIRTLRDPYTNKPYVGFYTTKRVGGGVVDSNAIKLMVLSV